MWRLLTGDCREVLGTLPAESIDACVTDPPYGIGFMGREWDTFAPTKARASKAFAIGHGDKGRKDAINPNLRGRRQSPAMSPSQIEYDRTLAGQHGFEEWTRLWAVEVFRVLKPGGHLLVCGAPRSFHRMTCGVEDAGFEIRDCFSWLFGQGFPKSLNIGDGRGTALKPGWEPIIVARKPFNGSVRDVLNRFGTGVLNIDACRIDHGEEIIGDGSKNLASWRRAEGRTDLPNRPSTDRDPDLGRWPANVLLDEEAAAMLDEQTGVLHSGDAHILRRGGTTGKGMGYGSSAAGNVLDATYGDSGGASRFFYVAKPSREERDYGTEGLTARQRDDSRKAGTPGGDNPRNRGLQPRGNFHPTVKPVELMRWLVRLVTPINGIVLDPFTGSGTTGMACRYELRNFIGIEREAEYVKIAERRIGAVAPLFAGEASA